MVRVPVKLVEERTWLSPNVALLRRAICIPFHGFLHQRNYQIMGEFIRKILRQPVAVYYYAKREWVSGMCRHWIVHNSLGLSCGKVDENEEMIQQDSYSSVPDNITDNRTCALYLTFIAGRQANGVNCGFARRIANVETLGGIYVGLAASLITYAHAAEFKFMRIHCNTQCTPFHSLAAL